MLDAWYGGLGDTLALPVPAGPLLYSLLRRGHEQGMATHQCQILNGTILADHRVEPHHALDAGLPRQRVITSYSIHYTKLYELAFVPYLDGHLNERRVGRAFPVLPRLEATNVAVLLE